MICIGFPQWSGVDRRTRQKIPCVVKPAGELPVFLSSCFPRRAMTLHFKGNKQSLPSRPCIACGREMTWRKSWAKNWAQVKYCSDACRRRGMAHG
ncbi:DUF2256 domain-containing protein [Methyloversatilis sp. RAC08]|uniref:DUF2256 domain-containing protein n=1 Tax=Methyloversatilis sp. RAC08 TaxID=1842540 RepID=UPI003003275E